MVTGEIIYREKHAYDEITAQFQGEIKELAAKLRELDVTECDCCKPIFVTEDGIACYLNQNDGPHGPLYWFLTAWGGERLGLSGYQDRRLGVTRPT